MRVMLTVALLSTIAIAGCLSGDTDGTILPADQYAATFDVPEPPAVSGQETVDMLELFITDYPVRADNLPDHTGARDWMADQFESYGLEVYRQEFFNGIDQENILGILWGEDPNTWVVVGGHYDVTTTDCAVGNTAAGLGAPTRSTTCFIRPFTEGAYDDGSGTIQTVILAKAFAEQFQETGVKPYYTMVFSPFDGEERGLQGSQAFAEAIINDPETTGIGPFPYNGGDIEIRGMLDLDMAGLNWPGVDAPLYFDRNSVALTDFVEAARLDMGMPDDMIKYQGISLGRSDYAHFFNLEVPTGFFISDFEEFQLPGDVPVTTPPPPISTPAWAAYPFWHVEDTWETMVLMAGSEEDLAAGFQTVMDLSAGILHLMAFQPEVHLDAAEVQ